MLSWLLTGRRPLWAAAVLVILIILVVMPAVVIKPIVSFATARTQNATLVAALTALLGILATQIVNTVLARAGQRNQQELEDQRARAASLQSYLEQMGKLLLNHQLGRSDQSTETDNLGVVGWDGTRLVGRRIRNVNPEGENSRAVAQAQTLAVLEGLDSIRKRFLLQFLYYSALIYIEKPAISLAGANLSGADLRDANLNSASLSGANLSGANLRGANLRGANLHRADLSKEVFAWSGTDLEDANLRDAYLGDANLRDADLMWAALRGAYLRSANLRAFLGEVDLRDADLRDADLRDADLRDADLSCSDLRGADLSHAKLRGANLIGADLRNAKSAYLKKAQAQIDSAIGGANTKLPHGVQRPNSWTENGKRPFRDHGVYRVSDDSEGPVLLRVQ
ncbi:MAG: pentapeptide repeat-containing protein, partial [Pyrinomonadaceae bacterium]|nr:pentapeptide repeat-containing protein [Pyrinomonadaceae bacterium]